MADETDREARLRLMKFKMRGFEAQMERDRQERLAAARRVHAVWLNICKEHGLRPGSAPAAPASPSRSSDVVDRKVTPGRQSSAPWAVREITRDGECEWHQVPGGSKSEAQALAARFRKEGRDAVFQALQMGRRNALPEIR